MLVGIAKLAAESDLLGSKRQVEYFELPAHSLLNRALNHLRISQKEREHEAHPKGLPPEQAAMLAEAQDYLFGASTAVNRANPIGGPADPIPAPLGC